MFSGFKPIKDRDFTQHNLAFDPNWWKTSHESISSWCFDPTKNAWLIDLIHLLSMLFAFGWIRAATCSPRKVKPWAMTIWRSWELLWGMDCNRPSPTFWRCHLAVKIVPLFPLISWSKIPWWHLLRITFFEWSPPHICCDILFDTLSGIYFDILSDILFCICSGIYSDILSGINSHILSGIYSDIFSGINSHILSDILSDILSGILLGIYSDIFSGINSHILSDILSDILSGIPLGIYSDIFFWHKFSHSFWHSLWHSFWHSTWHLFWHFFLA